LIQVEAEVRALQGDHRTIAPAVRPSSLRPGIARPADPLPLPALRRRPPADQQSPAWPNDFWAPIKFIPLDIVPGSYLNFGGELRERLEHFNDPFIGLSSRSDTTYDMHRLLLNADLHIGDSFRTFVQFGNHLVTSRSTSPPTDVDRLDLQQGFADVKLPVDFGSADIRAWTVASNTGFTFASLWGQPRLGLQADVASGGGPGGTLESFNPLFPKHAYFTEASINSPINFIEAYPSVTVQPLPNFAIKAGIDVLWRYSTHDAFYQPPGVPLVPGSANDKRYLGAQTNLQAEWQATAHISVNAAYVHFFTEGFLEAAGADDIDFVGAWTSYKF